MKKKSKKQLSLLDKFNNKETKGNVENTAIKSLVDIVAGATIGPGLAAVSGKFSPLAGVLLIAAGHYLGDKSGVLRATGTSTLAFGIAKAKDYQENPELNTARKRLKGLGNDLLASLHLKWKKEQESKLGKSTKADVSIEIEEEEKEAYPKHSYKRSPTEAAKNIKDDSSDNELPKEDEEENHDLEEDESDNSKIHKNELSPDENDNLQTHTDSVSDDEIDFSLM
ncbi:MAG: hypothetical protein Crog4KO_14520 [Crocinitomicaceae bacterium]